MNFLVMNNIDSDSIKNQTIPEASKDGEPCCRESMACFIQLVGDPRSKDRETAVCLWVYARVQRQPCAHECVCICACLKTHPHVYVQMHTSPEARGGCQVSSLTAYLIPLRQDLSLNLELVVWGVH